MCIYIYDIIVRNVCRRCYIQYVMYVYTLLYVASEALGRRIPLYHHQTVLQRPLVASRIPYYYMAFSSICSTLALLQLMCELL